MARRRRNPTVLDILPWLLGGAAVVGTAFVVYKASIKPAGNSTAATVNAAVLKANAATPKLPFA